VAGAGAPREGGSNGGALLEMRTRFKGFNDGADDDGGGR
jgi:hypothetical protein